MAEIVNLEAFRKEKESRLDKSYLFSMDQFEEASQSALEIFYNTKAGQVIHQIPDIENRDKPGLEFEGGNPFATKYFVPTEWIANKANDISKLCGPDMAEALKTYILNSVLIKGHIDKLVRSRTKYFDFQIKPTIETLSSNVRLIDDNVKELLMWQMASAVSFRSVFDIDDPNRDVFLDTLPKLKDQELSEELAPQGLSNNKLSLKKLYRRYRVDSFKVGVLSPLEPAKLMSISPKLFLKTVRS